MTALVVFSLEPWDAVWRRNQYLVDGLLRADPGLRVLFVEPSHDVLHEIRSGRRAAVGAGLRTAAGYDGRLSLFQPTKWLPRAVGPFADVLLRRTLSRAVRRSAMRPDLLWVNDPSWAGLVDRSTLPALYDMTDDWLAADRPAREHDRIVANEAVLLRRCRAVVVCSTGLEHSRRGARPDVVLIPNAVDVQRYRRPAVRPSDLPDAPVALYVGTLHEDRLDVALVERTGAALAAAGATLLLVGPSALSDANVQRLRSAPGVQLRGARPYDSIPAYLQHAQVLVVPHIVDGFTDSLDPIKLYEYLAVGKPIVSTPVAGFRERAGDRGVDVRDPGVFPDTVVAALGAHTPAASPEGVPDWSDRVAAFRAVLGRLRSAPEGTGQA